MTSNLNEFINSRTSPSEIDLERVVELIEQPQSTIARDSQMLCVDCGTPLKKEPYCDCIDRML